MARRIAVLGFPLAHSTLVVRIVQVVWSAAWCGAVGYDLDSCSAKPTFNTTRCPPDSAVACWSLHKTTVWSCWPEAWAPSWSLNSGAVEADAACMIRWTAPGSLRAFYDGACTFKSPTAVPLRIPLQQQRSWEVARALAKRTVSEMNISEKQMLMKGLGWAKGPVLTKWYYVGNTAPIPRLGIPSLNMQDAADGFRTYWTDLVGTVTCWPSLLSLAATWDPDAVRSFAVALGKEFRGKGANAILGPSVNVHRVARNGRNFEYLSGEDPYLGAKLTRAYVQGAQSQRLIAVVKHWVMNEQETNRGQESSVVDEKTAWELYYPPFEAAVDAGVDAVMCSYNKVDNIWSCENEEQMNVLKNKMNFQGFIQSDWWATHSNSINKGLDQDMPGLDDWFTANALQQSPQAVDEACERILSAMYRADLMNTTFCSPPNCKESFMKNVTSPAHRALSRSLATQSVVLLKNEGGILPLNVSRGMKIAIIGAAANASSYNPDGAGQDTTWQNAWALGDYYSGGGSGHMTSDYVVTPLQGIRARAEAAGAQVFVSTSNNITDAVAMAAQADVVIVVAATTSGESVDRPNLSLDGADELIAAVAINNADTVVLLQVPGAVVMPWRHNVSAVLALFLGGPETGNAWASVLFGDHAPTGRLPLMMPETEEDTISPGLGSQVDYTEGLATSYRSEEFKAAFPFGHGLTYTTFAYLKPNQTECTDERYAICITMPVQNTGKAPGRTVAQLYLEFGDEAGHPKPFLKGFERTPVLLPGATASVSFGLTVRDLSFFHDESGQWVPSIMATAHIGESQADIRQTLDLADIPELWKSGWLDSKVVLLAVLALCLCGAAVYAAKNAFSSYDGFSQEEVDEESVSDSSGKE